MSHKNMLNPVTVTTLVSFVFAVALALLWGPSLDDITNKIFVLTLYALLVGSYALRIALVFVGVYAGYQVLWKLANDQRPSQMEVYTTLK